MTIAQVMQARADYLGKHGKLPTRVKLGWLTRVELLDGMDPISLASIDPDGELEIAGMLVEDAGVPSHFEVKP